LTKRDDSPHLLTGRVWGELYFACVEIDQYAPKEVIEALQSHLSESGATYRLEWYPGAEHGFAFVDRKPSAERHWEWLFALFRRNL
jgi:carboxymethylenebutenolidase